MPRVPELVVCVCPEDEGGAVPVRLCEKDTWYY